MAAAVAALSAVPPPLPPSAPPQLEQALAAALVEATSALMASGSGQQQQQQQQQQGPSTQIDFAPLAEVAGFLSAAGYKPRADWQSSFEAALLASCNLTAGGSSRGLEAVAAARALSALAAWGRRLPSSTAQAVLAATRQALPGAPAAALGPLLLALQGVGAIPDGAWICDWEGVSRQALDEAVTEPSAPIGTHPVCAPTDVASVIAAAARTGGSGPGEAWVARAAAAAAQSIPKMSDGDLATLASGLHGLRFRPTRG